MEANLFLCRRFRVDVKVYSQTSLASSQDSFARNSALACRRFRTVFQSYLVICPCERKIDVKPAGGYLLADCLGVRDLTRGAPRDARDAAEDGAARTARVALRRLPEVRRDPVRKLTHV